MCGWWRNLVLGKPGPCWLLLLHTSGYCFLHTPHHLDANKQANVISVNDWSLQRVRLHGKMRAHTALWQEQAAMSSLPRVCRVCERHWRRMLREERQQETCVGGVSLLEWKQIQAPWIDEHLPSVRRVIRTTSCNDLTPPLIHPQAESRCITCSSGSNLNLRL